MRYGFIGLGNLGGPPRGQPPPRGLRPPRSTTATRPSRGATSTRRHLGGDARGPRPAATPSSPACPTPPPPRPSCAASAARSAPGSTWIEMSTLGRDDILRLAALAAGHGLRTLEAPGHRRRPPRRAGRDHRAGGRRPRPRGPSPARASGHGEQALPHGPARLRRRHQGHHQHAGLHPPRRGRRGPDARPARRPRPRAGLGGHPRLLRHQLRPRDRRPARS